MPLSNAAAGFIGASVTLVLVIIFMILMVILVRQCLAFISKRNAIRSQMEHQRQTREQIRQRRGSVSEPIPATFDWHHAIRIEGTPPPSYVEAKDLPAIKGEADNGRKKNSNKKVIENAIECEARMAEGMVDKKSPVHANGVSVNSPEESRQEITVVQIEDRSGNIGGGEQPNGVQGETRTFTANYTDFDSAQRSS